jgi:outer membrane protein W
MRKVLALLVVVLALPTFAFGQSQKQTLSIFVTDVAASSSRTDSWPTGLGISYERMFAQRLSLQGSVAYEHHRSYPYVVESDGSITQVDSRRVRTMPIDVTARYHWLNDSRWKPFIGLGAHYVAAPSVDPRFRYENHLDGVVDGGTAFMFTPTIGVLLTSRMILGNREETYDSTFKVSAGVSWRF